MLDVSLIILCAGDSSRFELQAKKQWLRSDNTPLWLLLSNRLKNIANFCEIIITCHTDEISYMKNFSDDFTFIKGGSTRQNSIINALKNIKSEYVMITDVARVCVPEEVILNLIKHKEEAHCIVPILNINDTVIYENNTINRDKTKLIQTPQLSKTSILKKALSTNIQYTDDSSAIKANGGLIKYIQGNEESRKLTYQKDLYFLDCLKEPSNNFFTGMGLDIHAFEKNKKMFLGGVHIKSDFGFKAHSDGDVLIHSLIDALLGAIGAGDIGEFFPDTNEKYKDISSKLLLEHIIKFIYNVAYEIVNIDISIIAQKPKISPYKNEIKSSLSKILNIEKQFINIKATTSEELGFIGRSEGIAVQSIVLLKYYNWKKL